VNAETALAGALDENGLLIPGALASPERKGAYTVFAQRTNARVEWARWYWNARYFDVRLRLTAKKKYRASGWAPQTDAAGVVITLGSGMLGIPMASYRGPSATSGTATRLVYARRALRPDYNAAQAADRRTGFPGFDFLANECEYVWLVVCEADPDPHALALAGVLSSVMLGPIIAPDGKQIFGVNGARERLEALGALAR
jgi:hypothetical protein